MSKELDTREGHDRLTSDFVAHEVDQPEQATVEIDDIPLDCARLVIDLSTESSECDPCEQETIIDPLAIETSVSKKPRANTSKVNGTNKSKRRQRPKPEIQNNDPTKLYLREIGRFDLLTKDDEIRLSKKIEAAREAQAKLDAITDTDSMTLAQKRACTRAIREGERAKEEFVTANLRLVVSIAKGYSRVLKGVELLDIIQEGNIGMAHAVDKFDWKKGFKFSTYATWWIRQSISRGIANQNKLIRFPVHMVDETNELRSARKYLEAELQRTPSDDEVASYLGWTQEEIDIVDALNRQADTISLDEPTSDDSDLLIGDFVSDDSSQLVFELLESSVDTERFKEVLQEILIPRDYLIMVDRYGLDGEEPKTLQVVGDKFGLTRERIRQLNNQAMVKLRHPAYSHLMAKFKF